MMVMVVFVLVFVLVLLLLALWLGAMGNGGREGGGHTMDEGVTSRRES